MLTVGITGRSGSGKSSVGAYYTSLGFTVFDADKAGHQVTEPNSPALKSLVQTFGPTILDENAVLIRSNLAKIAFSSPQNTQKLAQIMHPFMLDLFLQAQEQALNKNEKLFFVDGAILLNSVFEPYCQQIVVVCAEDNIAIERIMKRDKNLSLQGAHQRLERQLSNQEMCIRANEIIINDTSEQNLQEQAQKVLEKLLQEAELL